MSIARSGIIALILAGVGGPAAFACDGSYGASAEAPVVPVIVAEAPKATPLILANAAPLITPAPAAAE